MFETRYRAASSNRSLKEDGKGTKRKGPKRIIPSWKRDQPACHKNMGRKRTNSSCDYWHPPECAKYKTKGCKSFIHNEDKNSQGMKHKKNIKPDRAITALGRFGIRRNLTERTNRREAIPCDARSGTKGHEDQFADRRKNR